MKTKRNMRWRLFADFKLQGTLCVRIVFYWVACQIAVIGTICGFSLMFGDSTSLSQIVVPAVVISSLVLPFALFDAIAFSNRFAGPILNFRRKFSDLTENDTAETMHFRPGDYYPDLSENFNKLRDKIQSKNS